MNIITASALALLSLSSISNPAPRQSKAPSEGVKVAAMCFFKYEQVSGMNKICYYDCLGSLTAITISSTSLCPLNINR